MLYSLKYFCEDALEYYYASANLLLDIKLSKSFHASKVDFLKMGPMTFKEFLLASGDDNLVEYLSQIDTIE